MEVNVARISKLEGIKEQFDIKDNSEQYEIDFCGENIKVIPPVLVEGSAVNYDDKIEVVANITANVELSCSRCLENYIQSINTSMENTFVREISDCTEDYYLYKGDSIDITDIVLGEIASQLPMKPLCIADCKGLCPVCGKNRNEFSCECKNEVIDSRLQILSKLLDK